jgi:Right handed beta helix region
VPGRLRQRLRPALALCAAAALVGGVGPGRATQDRARAVSPGSTVDIKGSTAEWRDLLVEALGTPGTTIRLGPDVDIDLTSVGPIIVRRGVTLTSVRNFPSDSGSRDQGRNAKPLFPARASNANGPRLYTRGHPRGLLQIPCTADPAIGLNDNVHLSNFRLQGPDYNIESSDDHLQIGIIVDSCVGVEISNMEISGWSWAGIRITDDPKNFGGGRIKKGEDVVIRGNYIHNNQHSGANGYGIDVATGATALIEENVFDSNRHSISGNGGSDGYWAERNLVLKGGGYHKLGFHTHVFDMHGTGNCGVRGIVNDSAWNCGRAGGLIAIYDNAFQYDAENDIKIRGTPEIEASILRNVFPHSRLEGGTVLSGGIALTEGKKNISIGKGLNANLTGYDSYGKYGICDFDGDGKDDLFLATGATWWYSSSGEFQWTYLRQARERIDQLKLGYINGDNRCDVLAANGDSWEVADGGTAPWRAIGNFAVPMKEVVLGRFGPPVAGLGQTSHAFRRAADGQWYVTSLAAPQWTPAQSSSIPLSKLRFADFTGDGVTDVLAVQGGRWSISESGTGSWQTLNPKLSQSVDALPIGDVDNDGRADVMRFEKSGTNALRVSVSWGGRGDWTALTTMTGIALPAPTAPVGTTLPLFAFTGRFDAGGGADLLVVDVKRNGRFANRSGTMWNSQYPY